MPWCVPIVDASLLTSRSPKMTITTRRSTAPTAIATIAPVLPASTEK